ncbi:hypothetical protein [Flavobacterium sp.]|uniref:hypothetical protein n=1 Tax=Flavobacterium sp. TaxID=239 RepID=UPI0039E6C950
MDSFYEFDNKVFFGELFPAFAFIFCFVNSTKGYRLYRGYAAARAFFCRATKETKMPGAQSFGDLLFSQFGNEMNSLRSNSISFLRIFEKQVPACHDSSARAHEERVLTIENIDYAWNEKSFIPEKVIKKPIPNINHSA